MHGDETPPKGGRTATRRVATKTETTDPEVDEALSRAAREAVRQPADPRLEKSFAKLGLFTDEPATDPEDKPAATVKEPARAQVTPPIAPVASPANPAHEPVSIASVALEESVSNLTRRVDLLTWLVGGLTAVVVLLALILIVRG